MNFNDLVSGFITLFACMLVNNWQEITQVFVDIEGGNKWVRLYFCFFFYFSVVIGINVVVAYTIDMYGSVERLENERVSILSELRKNLHESEDADLLDEASDEEDEKKDKSTKWKWIRIKYFLQIQKYYRNIIL